MSDTRNKLMNGFRRFTVMGGSLYGSYQVATAVAMATSSAMLGGVGAIVALPVCYKLLETSASAVMSMAGASSGHAMGGVASTGYTGKSVLSKDKDFGITKTVSKEKSVPKKEIPLEKFSFKRERPVVNQIKEAEVVRGMDDYSEGRKKVD